MFKFIRNQAGIQIVICRIKTRMNKIIIAAIASAAIATYLVTRRRAGTRIHENEPVRSHRGNAEKHLTHVFSKAKKQLL